MKHEVALVLGAGAFGTCIAKVLSKSFSKVILFVRSEDVYQSIRDQKENSVYLPGLKLEDNITAALEWKEVDEIARAQKVELIVSGLPTAGIGDFFKRHFERLSKYLDQEVPIVSLSKGIDPDTLELSDDLLFDLWPDKKELFTFLSGPSFAKEIMEEQITLVTLAGRSKRVLDRVGTMLNSEYFKVLMSYDVKGVLLGGALKNVIAIAGGIIEGLGYNHNTRAAMITRGIAEMLRIGKVYNARPDTFYGLSGMGDLILTTTGDLSRNKVFGLELSKGRKASDILAGQRTVVEGYKTTLAVHRVCEKYDIHARIFQGVYEVLFEEQGPRTVVEGLMRAPSRFEID